MYAIKAFSHISRFHFKNQTGGMLLMALAWLAFLTIYSIILSKMIFSETQSELLYAEERRAFYAAQSGLEYAIKRLLSFETNHPKDWQETINTGKNLSCEIKTTLQKNNQAIIQATGRSMHYTKQLEVNINYINLADYSIYSAGSVRDISVSKPESIHQNATVMPIFDVKELKTLSISEGGYYPDDCQANTAFKFPPSRKMAYVEDDIYLSGEITDTGYWVNHGDVLIKGSEPFTNKANIIYQMNSKAILSSKKNKQAPHLFQGGIITAGNIEGNSLFIKPNRKMVINFMKYSLNGGSLLIKKMVWRNIN